MLLQLAKRKDGVTATICTERIPPALRLDLEKHNAQYPPIEIRILKNDISPRFVAWLG